MPINKPTISHQLKTVKINKPKTSSVIHTNPNIIANTPHTRSHLRSGGLQWRKSSYDRREDVVDPGDISHSELKQCTRILRNVLANEENKSTSTEEGAFDCRLGTVTLVGSKSPDNSLSIERQNCLKNIPASSDLVDEFTEADSLSSIVDPKPILTTTSVHSQRTSHSKLLAPQPQTDDQYCTCPANQMHDSKKVTSSGDQSVVCARCHNIIPNRDHGDKDINQGPVKNQDRTYERYRDQESCKPYGDDKMDNIVAQLQMKVNEVGLIARATRDADLDRLVSEIDRALQQMIRENGLVFNHLCTIVKTLKWDNSALKQKIKIQSDTNRDLKSEVKLLRQEHRQKLEESKMELQLKMEEIRLLTERDKTNGTIWSDKYRNLEKEYDKLRCECQAQMLQMCQKDSEIVQLRHGGTQSESKLKEQIHSLTLAKDTLQTELSKAQDINRKFDHECQHNQAIIKAAREHVISLLDRHKLSREGPSCLGFRYDSQADSPQNGSGDWISQATSLQQVLSMVSDTRDGIKAPASHNGPSLTSTANYRHLSGPGQHYDQSASINISPINFATTNYNNNYVSSSTYNPNMSELSKRLSDNDATPMLMANSYHEHRSVSRSPSDISSTISHNSLSYCQRHNVTGHLPDELEYQSRDLDVDDSWRLDVPKAKMSAASSVQSTISSLRSTDDREFRTGLQRLDSQISRLQTTLQSKLVCK